MITSSGPDSVYIHENNPTGTPLQFLSAVSWAAVLAGAAAAAALSLILLLLGVGLGLSALSPWAQEGVEADTLSISAIGWITFMSLAASGVGGYLAGRLRTRWVAVASDEVYFRDTAHGFLAWAIATLVTATLLTSVVGSIVSGGVKAGAGVVGGAASAAVGVATAAGGAINEEGVRDYFVDSLFRTDPGSTTSQPAQRQQSQQQQSGQASEAANGGEADADTGIAAGAPAATGEEGEVAGNIVAGNAEASAGTQASVNAEVARIFVNSLWQEEALPSEDAQYVAALVAQRTDLSQGEAEQRVNEIYGRLQARLDEMQETAKVAADEARSASAYTALWFSFSLFVGAFVASLAATFGGRQRDF